MPVLVPHHEATDGGVGADPCGEIETEALACLASPKPRRRVRGLRLLASIEAPADLVEWCLLLVDDDEVEVSVAALEMLASHCVDVNPFLVEDLAADQDRRLRAAALPASSTVTSYMPTASWPMTRSRFLNCQPSLPFSAFLSELANTARPLPRY